MSVRFHVDDSAAEHEFDRLDNMGAAVHDLEQVLALQYAAGQAGVHVVTGSLRNSEKYGSAYASGRWEGEISFGGESAGFPNDPVVYAVYEAARGYPHDYTISITRLSRRYGQAVREHLSGRP